MNVDTIPPLLPSPNRSRYYFLLSLQSKQRSFCYPCFDEVCSRCSTARHGVGLLEEMRIDGKPVCAEPPVGATAPSSGTTIANLTLENGYFRTSNNSHDILQCYQKKACLGGKDAGNYCAPGYTGPCKKAVSGIFP